MIHTTFDEFIAEQTTKSDEPEIDRDEELKEWEKQLDRFYQMVESFLYSYIKEGKVQCHYDKKQLHERLLGSYQAKSLVLEIGRNEIDFNPVGTFLIGAKGRVDMIGNYGTVKFVLVPRDSSGPKISVKIWSEKEDPPPEEHVDPVAQWDWKIATRPPNIEYVELQEESFKDAIMEVLNG